MTSNIGVKSGRRGRKCCVDNLRLAISTLVLCGIAACSSGNRWDQNAQDQHVVRKGETLFEIGWRYGKDPADLARWNKLGDGSLIYPGDVIRLSPPSGSTAKATGRQQSGRSGSALPPLPTQPSPPFTWPSSGPVAVEFGQRPGSGTGVLIGGRLGESVKAGADGRVVYAGSGLIGYGKLIIIKHNDTYLSAYGYNASLLVKEGQTIKKGQKIATMGEGPGQEPRLHFEIRQNGEPVSPRQFLPAR